MISSHVLEAASACHLEDFDGHSVCIHIASVDFRMRLPEIAVKGIALELAEMIQEAIPESRTSVVTLTLPGKALAETERQTQAIKRRVIEARESEQPGQAFLLGIGYWPLSAPTAKE